MCGHYCFNKYWLFLFQVQEQLDTINMDKIVIESLKEENSRVKREKEDVEGLLVQYRQFEVCVLGLDIIISLWWVIFITVSISISHIFTFPRIQWSQYRVTLGTASSSSWENMMIFFLIYVSVLLQKDLWHFIVVKWVCCGVMGKALLFPHQ